jgi:hypothetical protein
MENHLIGSNVNSNCILTFKMLFFTYIILCVYVFYTIQQKVGKNIQKVTNKNNYKRFYDYALMNRKNLLFIKLN